MSDPFPPPGDAPTVATTAPPARHVRVPRWLAVVIALAVLFAGGIAIGRWAFGTGSATAARSGTTTTTNAPARATDPNASALSGVVLQHGDVGSALNVQLIGGGDQVQGQPTLDLCNGKFASESNRTGRLQVAALDSQGNGVLSTEAVLYSNPADTAQAFSELKSVAAKCPNAPVVSPVGEPTVTTHLNPPPDASWPQVPTVDRLAYSFTATGQSGQPQPSVAVYLRRGRALMGIYFPAPSSIPAVSGQTTIPGIVNVFATRLAQLPAATVNGP